MAYQGGDQLQPNQVDLAAAINSLATSTQRQLQLSQLPQFSYEKNDINYEQWLAQFRHEATVMNWPASEWKWVILNKFIGKAKAKIVGLESTDTGDSLENFLQLIRNKFAGQPNKIVKFYQTFQAHQKAGESLEQWAARCKAMHPTSVDNQVGMFALGLADLKMRRKLADSPSGLDNLDMVLQRAINMEQTQTLRLDDPNSYKRVAQEPQVPNFGQQQPKGFTQQVMHQQGPSWPMQAPEPMEIDALMRGGAKCFFCGVAGHFARDCFKRNARSGQFSMQQQARRSAAAPRREQDGARALQKVRFSNRKMSRQQKIKRLQEVFAEELDHLNQNSDSAPEEDDETGVDVAEMGRVETAPEEESDDDNCPQQQLF